MSNCIHDIRIKPKTYERLVKYGKFGESYDDLMQKILNVIEDKQTVMPDITLTQDNTGKPADLKEQSPSGNFSESGGKTIVKRKGNGQI